MKSISKILCLLAIVALASCRTGKVPFTSDIQKQYGFSEQTLKKVQFYTSSEIILYKVKDESDAQIRDGKLFVLNQKDCEKIIIKANTPCILEKVLDKNKMLFSFELGANKYIAFGNASGGSYSLLAREWQNSVGTLKYADKLYVTNDGDVYLNVVLKKLNKLKSRERTVKGRKI